MCNFPNGNFPKVRLGPLRRRRLHLGSFNLEKYLGEVATWKESFGKVPNIISSNTGFFLNSDNKPYYKEISIKYFDDVEISFEFAQNNFKLLKCGKNKYFVSFLWEGGWTNWGYLRFPCLNFKMKESVLCIHSLQHISNGPENYTIFYFLSFELSLSLTFRILTCKLPSSQKIDFWDYFNVDI